MLCSVYICYWFSIVQWVYKLQFRFHDTRFQLKINCRYIRVSDTQYAVALQLNGYTNFIISFGGFFCCASLENKCLFVKFCMFHPFSLSAAAASNQRASLVDSMAFIYARTQSSVLSYGEFILIICSFFRFDREKKKKLLYAFVISYSDCDFVHKYLLIAHLKLFREMVYQCKPHVWSAVCVLRVRGARV